MNTLVMKLDTIAIDLECLIYNYFSERTDLNFYLTSDIYSFTRLARLMCFILIQIANNEIYFQKTFLCCFIVSLIIWPSRLICMLAFFNNRSTIWEGRDIVVRVGLTILNLL